jgi:myo-inositol catabolism protein IolH
VHQHVDIGQGEVDWDEFFGTLGRLGFGEREETIMTVCVFAWEERAHESSRFMRSEIERYAKDWSTQSGGG